MIVPRPWLPVTMPTPPDPLPTPLVQQFPLDGHQPFEIGVARAGQSMERGGAIGVYSGFLTAIQVSRQRWDCECYEVLRQPSI